MKIFGRQEKNRKKVLAVASGGVLENLRDPRERLAQPDTPVEFLRRVQALRFKSCSLSPIEQERHSVRLTELEQD